MMKAAVLTIASLLLIGSQAYGDTEILVQDFDLALEQELSETQSLPGHPLLKRMKKNKDGKAKPKKRPGLRACQRAQLTQDQRAEMRKALVAFRLKAVDLRANVKKARILYRQTLFSKDSTADQADVAAAKVEAEMSKLILARLGLKNEILMDIADVKQRRPLLRCLNQRLGKKGKRRPRGPRPGLL